MDEFFARLLWIPLIAIGVPIIVGIIGGLLSVFGIID